MLVHVPVVAAVVVVHPTMIVATTIVEVVVVASVMTVVVPIVIIRVVEIEIDGSSEREVLPESLSLLLVFYSYDSLFDECE